MAPFTFHVLCGAALPWGRERVSVQAIDAASEREAAQIACERFGWSLAKVRRANAPAMNGRYLFSRYAASGRRMG